MELIPSIQSQFQASLAMLKQVVEKCPDTLWDNPADKTKFWRIAYHTLFFTHLYLQKEAKVYSPWVKHRDEAEFLGPLPLPPNRQPREVDPYSREDILEFIEFCQGEVSSSLQVLDFDSPSGFDWLPFGKFELQIYNIRHLMQHTGELSTILNMRENILTSWIIQGN